MEKQDLDDIDREILYEIQKGIRIERRPFLSIAEKLKISEDEVINRIRKMIDMGIIRKFGLRIDVQNLKYSSTLIAMKVDEEYLDEVASEINKYESVTHSYLRNGSEYNLWIVVIENDEKSLNDFIERIKRMKGVKDILNLPVKRRFKINVIFRP